MRAGLRYPVVPLFLTVFVCGLLVSGCPEEDEDDLPLPAQVPSSFQDPKDRDVEAYKVTVRETVARGEPLHPLFGSRSRSALLVEKLALKPDDVVADIGCGTGAMELMMLETGVPFGKIHAVDVDGEVLQFLEFALAEARPPGVEKVEVVKSSYDDVSLPEGSIDVLFLLNTPFYLDDKGKRIRSPAGSACLRSIHRSLKPDGRLHVIERSLEPDKYSWCDAIHETFSEFGFEKLESEMIGIGVPGEGDHCWSSFAPIPAEQPAGEADTGPATAGAAGTAPSGATSAGTPPR